MVVGADPASTGASTQYDLPVTKLLQSAVMEGFCKVSMMGIGRHHVACRGSHLCTYLGQKVCHADPPSNRHVLVSDGSIVVPPPRACRNYHRVIRIRGRRVHDMQVPRRVGGNTYR